MTRGHYLIRGHDPRPTVHKILARCLYCRAITRMVEIVGGIDRGPESHGQLITQPCGCETIQLLV